MNNRSLFNLVSNNNLNRLKSSINHNTNLNIINDEGQSLLILATLKDNLEIVELLIDSGVNVNLQDNSGNNALMVAIDNKIDFDIIKLLIISGTDINLRNNIGDTALIIAVKKDSSLTLIEFLINAGADINIINNNGDNALKIASEKKYNSIIKLLTKTNFVNFGPLGLIERGNNEGLKKYFEKTNNINTRNNDNITPLMYAIMYERIDMIKLLIRKGANVHLKDKYGRTPLIYAVLYFKYDIIKLLLDEGASVNLQIKDGKTPLMLSLSNNTVSADRYEIVKLLINRGANVNLQDNSGNTALIIAINNKIDFDIIKLLTSKNVGVDVNLQDNSGKTALIIAIKEYSNFNLIKLLLKKGANVNLQDEDGNTAFIYSIIFIKNLEIIKLLINSGADIYLKNNDGNNAIIFAFEEEDPDIISLLCDYYPEIYVKKQINIFKTNKSQINIKSIFDYYYNLANYYSCINKNTNNFNEYKTIKNQELSKLINNIKKSNKLLTEKIKIQYENSVGVNAGGLSREFFDNLETQINLKYKAQKELEEKSKLLETYISQQNKLRNFRKNKNIKKENNTNNENTRLNDLIKILKNEKDKLEEIIINSKNYDIKDILNILAISKKNCNPIYYDNNNFKQFILNEITKLFDIKIEKNFIYNVLNYLSSNDILDDVHIYDLLLNKDNKKKIDNFLVNKNIYNEDKIINVKNDYIKVKYNNNNTNLKYLKPNNLKELNSISNQYISNNIYSNEDMDLINIFINIGIYKNIFDFFLSHFVVPKITIESFLGNYINKNSKNTLTFDFESVNLNIDEKKEIIKKFVEFFKTFTQDELYLFNKTISGSTYKLSKRYMIKIVSMDSDNLPVFHTCFNTMDVSYPIFKNKYFDNKNEFIDVLKQIIGVFSIA